MPPKIIVRCKYSEYNILTFIAFTDYMKAFVKISGLMIQKILQRNEIRVFIYLECYKISKNS